MLIGGNRLENKWLQYNCEREFKYLFAIVSIVSLVFCALNLFVNLFPYSDLIQHDEVEHLRIILGFAKGFIPYKDYTENHPILIHILAHKFLTLVGIKDALVIYVLFKFILWTHLIGTVVIIFKAISKLNNRPESKLFNFGVFFLAIGILQIWSLDKEWIWGFNSIFQLRPDWIAVFWGLLALYLHSEFLRNAFSESKRSADKSNDNYKLIYWGVLIGLCAGVSLAVLPKIFYYAIPYVLSLILAAYFSGITEKINFRFWKSIVGISVVAFLVAIGFLILCAIFEVNFLGLSLKDYYKYVFLLNSSKHPILFTSGSDYNPLHISAKMLNLDFLGFVGVTFGILFLTGQAIQSKSFVSILLLIMADLLLIFNWGIPAFSNGIQWPWYYMPTAFAFLVFYCFSFKNIKASSNIKFKNILLIGMIGWTILSLPNHVRGFLSSQLVTCLISKSGQCFKDIANPNQLPEDLNYLSGTGLDVPLTAKIWNYYMLGATTDGFWLHYHELELGPHPESAFITKAKDHLPDVILFKSLNKLSTFFDMVNYSQKINIKPAYEFFKFYQCMGGKEGQVLVRPDLVGRFLDLGFYKCAG